VTDTYASYGELPFRDGDAGEPREPRLASNRLRIDGQPLGQILAAELRARRDRGKIERKELAGVSGRGVRARDRYRRRDQAHAERRDLHTVGGSEQDTPVTGRVWCSGKSRHTRNTRQREPCGQILGRDAIDRITANSGGWKHCQKVAGGWSVWMVAVNSRAV